MVTQHTQLKIENVRVNRGLCNVSDHHLLNVRISSPVRRKTDEIEQEKDTKQLTLQKKNITYRVYSTRVISTYIKEI